MPLWQGCLRPMWVTTHAVECSGCMSCSEAHALVGVIHQALMTVLCEIVLRQCAAPIHCCSTNNKLPCSNSFQSIHPILPFSNACNSTGVYPFAGHEVARAFAMLSTDVADCTADLDGMSHIELENLREWEQKFNYKYPVVGRIRGSKEPAAAGAAAAAAAGSQQG